MTNREHGYYYVTYSGKSEIAHWDGEAWSLHLVRSDCELLEEDFDAIGGKVPAAEQRKNAIALFSNSCRYLHSKVREWNVRRACIVIDPGSLDSKILAMTERSIYGDSIVDWDSLYPRRSSA